MEEQYLDFDYAEPKEELSKYDKKRIALKKEYEKIVCEEQEENSFRKKILEFNSGIYYILFYDKIFDRNIICDDDDKVVDYEFKPKLLYVLYDGYFIVTLTIKDDGYYYIKRTTVCKLPQVDIQLENYNIKLKAENIEHSCGYIQDYPSIDQIRINRELTGPLINARTGKLLEKC